MSRYQKKTEEKRSDNSQKGIIHCLISSIDIQIINLVSFRRLELSDIGCFEIIFLKIYSTCHSLNKKLNTFIIVSFKIIKLYI
ncbi:MAG: hypothetical protein DRR08_29425 [Candidatus Parabeggiatoa sp. nov. 2]|nr:MAG: hypothetical protein B6247_13585 [Beggiatoa sp. 4572_84]RKZ51301.1 MAG: hypothetical protein DRR08_29425 [Gammaproteobacteria bacterium]